MGVFSSSQGCRLLSPSSSGDGSWAGSSSGSPAAASEAERQQTARLTNVSVRRRRAENQRRRSADLGLLALDAPDAAGTVHHRVLGHDLARVDLAARANDAAAGEDHVPAEISWEQTDAKQQ